MDKQGLKDAADRNAAKVFILNALFELTYLFIWAKEARQIKALNASN